MRKPPGAGSTEVIITSSRGRGGRGTSKEGAGTGRRQSSRYTARGWMRRDWPARLPAASSRTDPRRADQPPLRDAKRACAELEARRDGGQPGRCGRGRDERLEQDRCGDEGGLGARAQVDVPRADLGPLEAVVGPRDVPRAQVDLAVLADGPGQVGALDREVLEDQGQVVGRASARTCAASRSASSGRHRPAPRTSHRRGPRPGAGRARRPRRPTGIRPGPGSASSLRPTTGRTGACQAWAVIRAPARDRPAGTGSARGKRLTRGSPRRARGRPPRRPASRRHGVRPAWCTRVGGADALCHGTGLGQQFVKRPPTAPSCSPRVRSCGSAGSCEGGDEVPHASQAYAEGDRLAAHGHAAQPG